jgi:hypothetical protein
MQTGIRELVLTADKICKNSQPLRVTGGDYFRVK